ncbi:MAG: tetratricopeptide repeat protein, partial [Zavarzinella sp.]|nr:tetratricopeptide repeat protein [Zavarzinella sp.]
KGEAAGGTSAAPRRAVRLVAALVLAGATAGGLYWKFAPGTVVPKPAPPRLADLNEDPDGFPDVSNPGYLGPRACSECHAARVDEFLKTAHARACRRAQDGPMPPGFEPGRGTYVTADPDLRFEMTREAGEFFETALLRTPAGERRTKSRIDLVYGANKADEVFFSWRGDHRLYELMTVWVHPWDGWGNTSYNQFGAGEYAREATTRCLECHNTWFAHVPGTANQYRPDSFVLGVTCERCHGPGNEHVEFHRAHPRDEAAHAIVHPGHLSRERLIEVCTQCHGNSTKPRGPTLSYRPGEPLEKYYRTARTPHPEDDHVANQVKYLRQSKCFQKSETMTCVTCHDPHRPHDRADVHAAQRSCLQCHKPEACTDRPNLPTAVRDNCTACHMPQRVWMNVHFHTTDDRYVPAIRRYQHRIANDRVARSEVLLAYHRTQGGDDSRREADRLARELAEHWLKQAGRLRQEYRFLAAIGAAREALRLDAPAPLGAKAKAALAEAEALQTKVDRLFMEALRAAGQQRPAEAIGLLNDVLAVKPDFAPAHSKLGTLYAATGQFDRATEHLARVAKDDPDNASGLAMLGWLAYLGGRGQEAVEYYRQADEIEPFDAKINYHWALALIRLDRWADAADRLRRVLRIDPTHAAGSRSLAVALLHLNRTAEAVRYAWRAARLTEFRDPETLVTLADAYSNAGRLPEAAAAAAAAIEHDE